MEDFDPSAFLAKRTSSTESSLSNSDSGVTTVNVKSSEELDTEEETGVNREETGENKEQTSRQGSEVITKSLCYYYYLYLQLEVKVSRERSVNTSSVAAISVFTP